MNIELSYYMLGEICANTGESEGEVAFSAQSAGIAEIE